MQRTLFKVPGVRDMNSGSLLFPQITNRKEAWSVQSNSVPTRRYNVKAHTHYKHTGDLGATVIDKQELNYPNNV